MKPRTDRPFRVATFVVTGTKTWFSSRDHFGQSYRSGNCTSDRYGPSSLIGPSFFTGMTSPHLFRSSSSTSLPRFRPPPLQPRRSRSTILLSFVLHHRRRAPPSSFSLLLLPRRRLPTVSSLWPDLRRATATVSLIQASHQLLLLRRCLLLLLPLCHSRSHHRSISLFNSPGSNQRRQASPTSSAAVAACFIFAGINSSNRRELQSHRRNSNRESLPQNPSFRPDWKTRPGSRGRSASISTTRPAQRPSPFNSKPSFLLF